MRLSKSTLRRIIISELVCVLLASYAILWMSNRNICLRTSANIYSDMKHIDNDMLSTAASKAYKESSERIVEEVEEIVWTTASVDYRTGPDDSYKSVGTMDKDRGVQRTGLTRNDWSRVYIDESEYYILSDSLTEEAPVEAIIEEGQKGEYQKYALSLFPDYGWESSELEPLINLWNRESHWNPGSHNGRTGAHGIPQAVPGSKMASAGSDWSTNGFTQVRWGLGYISGRYGSPSNAWSHFTRRNWY